MTAESDLAPSNRSTYIFALWLILSVIACIVGNSYGVLVNTIFGCLGAGIGLTFLSNRFRYGPGTYLAFALAGFVVCFAFSFFSMGFVNTTQDAMYSSYMYTNENVTVVDKYSGYDGAFDLIFGDTHSIRLSDGSTRYFGDPYEWNSIKIGQTCQYEVETQITQTH